MDISWLSLRSELATEVIASSVGYSNNLGRILSPMVSLYPISTVQSATFIMNIQETEICVHNTETS